MKNLSPLLLPFTLILGLLLPACNPGDTSTPLQFSYTAAPFRTTLPPAADPSLSSSSAVPTSSAAMTLSSPAFANNGPIPQKFTCQADSISPQLQFSNIPTGAQSLALTLLDPDAPGGVFVHWVIYNMAPTLSGLAEDVPKHAGVTGVGTQGLNGAGLAGYTGPCPPAGGSHRYIFTLYALDIQPILPQGLTANTLQTAMQAHILAQAHWVGLYQK